MKQNVSIIYSHLLWADALKALINSSDHFRVSQVFSIEKTNVWANGHNSIYLLEATYPNGEIVEVVKFLRNLDHKVMVVGYHIDNEFVEVLLEMGLNAYVLKTCREASLFEALRQVSGGNKFFCAPITEALSQRLKEKTQGAFLTTREKDVLTRVVSMESTVQIANELNISEATVRTHRKNIMQKFGAKNYLGLLRYACREGLLNTPNEQFCLGCKKMNCKSPHLG